MNKQLAKQMLMGNVNACYNAVKENGWQSEMLKENIDRIVDALEPDHQKVKLPREVGEELDKTVSYLKTEETYIYAFDYLAGILYDNDEWENHPNLSGWYNRTDNAALILADAYRYGWEAEPEEWFYVEAPENWNAAVGQEYRWVSMCDGEFSLTVKGQAQTFTRAELKKYHLDSDIFTLVPLEVTDNEVY